MEHTIITRDVVGSNFPALCYKRFARQTIGRVLVTLALWLNLSDSMNILIIHFGLLLKERTLDSIGIIYGKQI